MSISVGDSGRILGLKTLLKNLTADDVSAAVNEYDRLGGDVESYENSSTYDLVIDGNAYPPKAIFGLAASRVLKTDVRSEHFTGGENSASFKLLRELGFSIVQKVERPGPKDGLVLYRAYSRGDVQRILGPGDSFTPGAGIWGIQGIVRNRPKEGDAVFFVTLGNHDGNDYEDALTEDGVLIWQSQNRSSPTSPIIRQLVAHDETENVIYLFLRGREGVDYRFLGPVALKEWDPRSANPVHMTWTLLSGFLTREMANELGLKLKPALSPFKPKTPPAADSIILEETAPPKPPVKRGPNGPKKRGYETDWKAQHEKNHELGLLGEQLILRKEKEALDRAGRSELAAQVEHTALINPAAGYDIVSFDPATGEKRFIEVKTTTGKQSTAFFISKNEVTISEEHRDSYWIYRVYECDYANGTAKFYTKRGSVRDNFDLLASEFQATVKN